MTLPKKSHLGSIKYVLQYITPFFNENVKWKLKVRRYHCHTTKKAKPVFPAYTSVGDGKRNIVAICAYGPVIYINCMNSA